MVPCSRSRTIAAPENDRQHGDAVDDAHDAREPRRRDVGVEGDAHGEIDRLERRALRVGDEVGDFRRHDLLRIAGPEARLHHRGRVDIDLKRGLAAGQDVALEIWRDVDHERVSTGVHQWDDVALGDPLRRLKERRQEGMSDPSRELRMVFIDDGDRRVVKLLREASRLHDDRKRERIDDEAQKDVIAQETPQFLEAQPIDV
jgi:hypothetical protein